MFMYEWRKRYNIQLQRDVLCVQWNNAPMARVPVTWKLLQSKLDKSKAIVSSVEALKSNKTCTTCSV